MIDAQLSRAVVAFLGYRTNSHPAERADALEREFGESAATALQKAVSDLLDEMNAIKPDWGKHTLVSAGQWARGEMRHKHPELDDEALAALEWAFAWWWR